MLFHCTAIVPQRSKHLKERLRFKLPINNSLKLIKMNSKNHQQVYFLSIRHRLYTIIFQRNLISLGIPVLLCQHDSIDHWNHFRCLNTDALLSRIYFRLYISFRIYGYFLSNAKWIKIQCSFTHFYTSDHFNQFRPIPNIVTENNTSHRCNINVFLQKKSKHVIL